MPDPPPTRSHWFEQVGPRLAHLYLLRVPLIVWSLLVAFPFLAVPDRAPFESLLRGIFDIALPYAPGWSIVSFFLVTLASLMTATAAGVAARLILLDGHERFGAARYPNERPGARLALRLISLSGAIPVVVGAWWQTGKHLPWWAIAPGIAGGLVVFLLIMKGGHDLLWNVVHTPEGDGRAWVRILFAPAKWLLALSRWVVALSPAGYVDPATHVMRERHTFAVLQAFVSLLLYTGLGIGGLIGFGEEPVIPTLCLVLVLLMVVCLTLSAITFFFDRFRIPVLAIVAIYGTAVSMFPQGDAFYQAVAKPIGVTHPRVPPEEVFRPRAGQPVILIAAAGGGIQAAAWTTHVVAGIRHGLPEEAREAFDRSIRVISGVSGGSVGAMYIADAYQQGRLPDVTDDIDRYPAVAAARASSLDAVAWGLVYPDLIWTLVPFARGIWFWPFHLINGPNLTSDRGSALEDAWKRTPTLSTVTLDEWREDVLKGNRPAVIFNATVVETGERLLLSTTDMSQECPAANFRPVGHREFACEYDDVDVQVATAARLSATFPYVTPAARILQGGIFAREYHVVDGGYYDNYGVATLVEWLNGALQISTARPSRILIIQIRATPSVAHVRPDGSRGWWFQALHPVTTLLSVRDTGQRSHNDLEVGLLKGNLHGISITTADFEFAAERPDGDPVTAPLSWRLTPDEQAAIGQFWESSATIEAQRKVVLDFLAP